MRHVIRKQVINLTTTDAAAAFRMQQDAAKYYHQEICPLLEKIFDELAPGDQYILLDHIEIDLGWIVHDAHKGFAAKENIEKKLRTQLQEIVAQARTVEQYNGADPGEQTALKKPAALHAFDQWLHYMRYGLLPWHAGDTGEAWRTKVLEALATDYGAKRAFAQQLQRFPVMATRIIRTHDAGFLVQLIAAVTAVKQTELPLLVEKLVAVITVNDKQKLEEKIWTGVLQHAVAAKEQTVSEQLVREAWLQTGLPEQLNPARVEQFVAAEPELKNILLPVTETPVVVKQKQELPEEPLSPQSKPKEQEETPVAKKANAVKPGKETPPAKRKVSKKQEDTTPPDETKLSFPGETEEDTPLKMNIAEDLPGEGIYIENAGLILLHPFFRFMMRNTGLVKDNAFVNRIEQQRAMYLLHFLATGLVEAEEHQLAMPKIICGWPLEEPVLTGLQVGASLQNEANDLLLAAIAQWTILKSTSPDGLREAFLQRPGKAVNGPNGLVIQVESSSIDLLLDHLPWNLSIIKLPWLEGLIRVEWR